MDLQISMLQNDLKLKEQVSLNAFKGLLNDFRLQMIFSIDSHVAMEAFVEHLHLLKSFYRAFRV